MNAPPSTVRRIALTGGIASGKSLAGDYLRSRGVPVIDADEVVHRLLREDEDLKIQIRQAFGDAVFDADGVIDRRKMAAHVFGDADKRRLLESWVHPRVRETIDRFYQEHAHAPLAVSVIPLLFESKLEDRYDEIWLMESSPEQQVARLTEKRAMALEEALARMDSQMPFVEKQRRAEAHPCHHVIRNTGSPQDVHRQLDHLLQPT